MILLIDNYDSFTFNVSQALEVLGCDVAVYRNDRISLEDIALLNPDAIVLSPGPGRPEEAGLSCNIIRHFSGQIPLLGICLGHQALGHVFGAKIINAGQIVHGKQAHIGHDGRGLFAGIEQNFKAGRYHSLVVDGQDLPVELKVTARTIDGTIMAMQHQSHPSFGVQFHPESVLTPMGGKLVQNFITLSKQRVFGPLQKERIAG